MPAEVFTRPKYTYRPINLYGEHYNIAVFKDHYRDGNALAVTATTDEYEPFTVFTTNLDESASLPKDTAFVVESKDEWKAEFLVNNHLAVPTDITAQSGFCTYRAYRFNLDKLES